MSESAMCCVPGCPAYAADGEPTCQPHVLAVCVTVFFGARGKPCLDCGRTIKKDEWVWREMRRREPGKGKPGDVYGWAHVACEPLVPRVTRQELKDAPKPLLVDL